MSQALARLPPAATGSSTGDAVGEDQYTAFCSPAIVQEPTMALASLREISPRQDVAPAGRGRICHPLDDDQKDAVFPPTIDPASLISQGPARDPSGSRGSGWI